MRAQDVGHVATTCMMQRKRGCAGCEIAARTQCGFSTTRAQGRGPDSHRPQCPGHSPAACIGRLPPVTVVLRAPACSTAHGSIPVRGHWCLVSDRESAGTAGGRAQAEILSAKALTTQTGGRRYCAELGCACSSSSCCAARDGVRTAFQGSTVRSEAALQLRQVQRSGSRAQRHPAAPLPLPPDRSLSASAKVSIFGCSPEILISGSRR